MVREYQQVNSVLGNPALTKCIIANAIVKNPWVALRNSDNYAST